MLSILAVHTFPDWLGGGMIGIDIFFVLSGYLITILVLGSLDDGSFRLTDFWQRRVLRIVPALCIVLLSILVFAVLFTFPGEMRFIARHVAVGSIFMSHLVGWNDGVGPADATAMVANPLLHLWTLGIEAWFYAVWPFVAIAIHRWGNRVIWSIAAALALLLLLAIAVVDHRLFVAFLPLPMRVGELMAGALLASLALSGSGDLAARLEGRLAAASPWRGRVRGLLGWSGFALLIAAMGLADLAGRSHVAWSLLPTAGTLLLLAAGASAAPNRHLLARPALRFYGAISYPLYLWHWPLFAFPLVVGIPLTNEVRVMILIASVALAALTLELVERPVRAADARARGALAWLTVLFAIGIAAIAVNERGDRLGALAPDCIDEGDDSGPCSWRSKQSPSQ